MWDLYIFEYVWCVVMFWREDLHKVDAIEFAHQRAAACSRAAELHDKRSAALLWNLLILLCRQNGVRRQQLNHTHHVFFLIHLSLTVQLLQQIVGSDIAELLMQGSHSDGSWASEAPTLIDFSDGATAEAAAPCKGDDLLTGDSSSFSSESSEKALQSYTQLLLAGRKKVFYLVSYLDKCSNATMFKYSMTGKSYAFKNPTEVRRQKLLNVHCEKKQNYLVLKKLQKYENIFFSSGLQRQTDFSPDFPLSLKVWQVKVLENDSAGVSMGRKEEKLCVCICWTIP